MNLTEMRRKLNQAAARARWANLKTPAERRKATQAAREAAGLPNARRKAERTKAGKIKAVKAIRKVFGFQGFEISKPSKRKAD